jgi:hypothetical protein
LQYFSQPAQEEKFHKKFHMNLKRKNTPKAKNAAGIGGNFIERDHDTPEKICLPKRTSDSPYTVSSTGSNNGLHVTPGTSTSVSSSCWNLNSYIVSLIEYRNRRHVRMHCIPFRGIYIFPGWNCRDELQKA